MSDNKIKEPKHFLVMRVLGFLLLAIGIVLIILACTVFSAHPFNDTFFPKEPNFAALAVGIFSIVISLVLIVNGFAPKFAKLNAKGARYIQQETKEDTKEIASTGADISSEAVTKTAKAIKKGIKDTKFCKHCGAEIDADSAFCKDCGKKQ